MNPLVFLAVSVAAVAASPAGVIYSPYSGLTGRVVYTGASPAVTLPALASPAVTLPASPVSPLSSVNTDAAALIPNIPGLDATQKELLGMVAAVQPEITAQLARIGANIGAWTALNAAGSSLDLALLPPTINAQMASITASGQSILGSMERFLAEIVPEVDNLATNSNSLLQQIPAALPFVPVELRGQITELTDATSKIAAIMQSMTPRLKALSAVSLATQKAQLADNQAKIAGAQNIQAAPRFGVYFG